MNIRNQANAPRWRHTALAVALSMSLGGVAMAQSTTGSIFGQAPAAAGETVSVANNSGVSREVEVDSSGRFRVSNLPVGKYTVTLKKDGNAVDTRKNVALSAGAGTSVTFESSGNATSLSAVTVTATGLPTIDVSNVNSSMTITAADLQKLPVGRNAESIALLAPGTVAGSGYFGNAVSFGGSGITENAYYVNGFNTGEPYRNTGGFQLPYGSIDQQQTFTGGYSAQYGRSDGGVINQIGKRGTNEWHFGGQVAWAPRFLDEGGKNVYYPTHGNIPAGYAIDDASKEGTLYQYRQANKSWETIYSAYFGGPLIQDKLYFFGSVDTTKTKGRNVRPVDIAKDVYYSDHETNYYAKLDWNINDNNILELTKLRTEKSGDDIDGSGAAYDFDYSTLTSGPYAATNNITKHQADFTIAKYTSYITDEATLSILYGKGDFKNPFIYPGNDLPYISGAGNQRGGQNIVNNQLSPNAYSATAANHSKGLRADFTYQVSDHLLGVGIDNMTSTANNQGQAMSGPGYYWAYNHTATPTVNLSNGLGIGPTGGDGYYVRKRVTVFQTSMSMEQKAYYLQDVWNVTDRLQLNIGLRNDRFTNYNDVGIAFVDEKNQWEPRLGASWDVNGDSTFKIYGNAGRYYLALPNNVAERAANRSTLTYQYFNYTGIDANGVPTGLTPIAGTDGNPNPGPVTPDGEFGLPKDAKQVTASNLKAQYQDEYILGFDKALGSDWVYGAKLTYRALKTAIDDECSPSRIATKMTATGLDPNDYYDSLYGAAYCRLINPGLTNTMLIARDDGTGYANVTMTQQDWGYVKKAKRTYAGLDLYLEHPFDGTWQGRLDYTFARNRGNTEGQVRSDFGQADVSKTEDWDAWQLMDHADGDLANSRKHSIRARGAYQITPEWLVSGTLLVQSGTPKECLGYFGTDESDPVSYGADYHYCFGKPTPPGSTGFTPWTKKLNLGIRYAPAFADHKLAFQMNIYNVLNEQKTVQIDPNSVGDPYTVSNTWNMPVFQESPRYVRLSVSYDY
jgi:hypothetical protein